MVLSYTDIFDILNQQLIDNGVGIPDFSKNRLYYEKELSKTCSPKLAEIYDALLSHFGIEEISSDELAEMEWNIDFSQMVARTEMCNLLKEIVCSRKKVVITTDCYYSFKQVKQLLEKINLDKIDDVLVSCEHGTGKAQSLYEKLKELYPSSKILHVGDDDYSDIEKSSEHGIDSFKIYSGAEFIDNMGGLGIEDHIKSLTDRVKAGLLVSRLFNNPFQFESEENTLSVNTSYDVGYLFCAPMMTDFVYWLHKKASKDNCGLILFCSRDGYLPIKLFQKIASDVRSCYFLSSRTAAIRAGIDNLQDISYVDSMKYFGTDEEALSNRFGIDVSDVGTIDKNQEILKRSSMLRTNYKKYISTFEFSDSILGVFDFVAKGTTQLYLQKIFTQHMKGYYFLQLEPEYMADKGIEIEPFYSDEEKSDSAIFEYYYFLETILTAPHSQVLEFDQNGKPIFALETRNEKDIDTILSAQDGIIDYFLHVMQLIPAHKFKENKKLDEILLSLITKIKINDIGFTSLTVEDPFFGRMTDIKDVIG